MGAMLGTDCWLGLNYDVRRDDDELSERNKNGYNYSSANGH